MPGKEEGPQAEVLLDYVPSADEIHQELEAALHEVEHGDKSQWIFGYHKPEDMPSSHREIARMVAILDLPNAHIASATGNAYRQVLKIRQHPPFRLHVANLKVKKAVEELVLLADFDELIPQAVAEIRRILGDKGAEDKDKLNAIKLILDRDPQGRFIARKQTKHQHEHAHRAVSSDDASELAEIGSQLATSKHIQAQADEAAPALPASEES